MTLVGEYKPESLMSPHLGDRKQERYTFILLDKTDQVIGELGGVIPGGTVENNVNAVIRRSGSINLTQPNHDIDWLSDRLKILYHFEGGSWPLGVFLVNAPKRQVRGTQSSWSVKLMDKLLILDTDNFDGPYAVPKGSKPTQVIKGILEDLGENTSKIEESDEVATSDRVWEAGTSKLRVINDLLESIGYFALWCDTNGYFRAVPYFAPRYRPIVWTFEYGPHAIHLPDWEEDQDYLDVPNKVTLVSQGDGDEEGFIATAINNNSESRYSTVRRGRVIPYFEDGVEISSLAALQQRAQQVLESKSTAVTNVSFAHMMMDFEGNDRLRFRPRGLDIESVIQKTKVTLKAGSLMETSVRKLEVI